MKRFLALAVLAVALFMGGAGPAQARLTKELQVVRSGTLALADDGQAKVYRLQLGGAKYIVIGDREFFPAATRAALDQALERKLTVEVAGHLLIYNDQAPVFTLPLTRLDVKGLDMGAASAQVPAGQEQPRQGEAGSQPADVESFRDAMLKGNPTVAVGKALDAYAFFSSRDWKVLDQGKAEFRGTINLSSVTEQDSRYVSRLLSPKLGDTFKSIVFVATLAKRPDGTVESPEPAVEAEFVDGARDRLVWKDPPNYYWDRIYRNRKIKLDYFLSKAALNPKYGKGMGPSGQ